MSGGINDLGVADLERQGWESGDGQKQGSQKSQYGNLKRLVQTKAQK